MSFLSFKQVINKVFGCSIMKGLKLFFLFLLLCFFSFENVSAKENDKNLVNIYFFHSDNCFHCKGAGAVLDKLEGKYSNIKIYRYEIHEVQNKEIYEEVKKIYKLKNNGVPLVIIGDSYYLGFAEEKSMIQYVRTIEYYSRYGYEDKVGEFLKIGMGSNLKVDSDIPSLEEFSNQFGNYQLFGNIYTDNFDFLSNAFLLGSLSQINLVNIIAILLIMFLLSKVLCQKNKIIILVSFFSVLFLLTLNFIFEKHIFMLCIISIVLGLFILYLYKFYKTRNFDYLYGNLFIVIAVITGYLEKSFYFKYYFTFRELNLLYQLSGGNKLLYYGNYIISVVIIDVLLVLIILYIKRMIFNLIDYSKR